MLGEVVLWVAVGEDKSWLGRTCCEREVVWDYKTWLGRKEGEGQQ